MSAVTPAGTTAAIRPKRLVVSARRGGDMALLDTERDRYFTLNDVGARVWELLIERPRALDALLDALEAEYDVTRETLRADVARLLEALAGARLVEWSEP